MSMRFLSKTAPLGRRADGSPFWALFGADGTDDGGDGDSGEGTDDSGDDSGEDEDDGTVGDDGLTAKGRKAIDAERTAAKRARERLKPYAALARETGLTVEEMRARLTSKGKPDGGDKSGETIDPDQIRAAAKAEAMAEVNQRLVRVAVTQAALDVLENPADAAMFLDLGEYEVGEDGEVDAREIKRDLKALLAERPYLAKAKKGDGRDGGPPNFDGGTRRTSSGPLDMNALIRAARNRR